MNVHHYAAKIQQSFNSSFYDYEVLTTFAGDFAIAECYSVESIKETAETAWDEWKEDYKWATEIIMVLNWLCWYHHDMNNVNLSRVYGDLYYEYKDKFYEEFAANTEATDYFFDITD